MNNYANKLDNLDEMGKLTERENYWNWLRKK